MKNKSTILFSLAVLAFCVWTASAAAPSARPVESIDAKFLLPGHETCPVEFRPGTVRLRMPSATVDLALTDIICARYSSAPLSADSSDLDSDQCTIVTINHDILVGRCSFHDFRRLLKADFAEEFTDGPMPSAILFVHPGAGSTPDVAAPADSASAAPWAVKLENGSMIHVRPRADILRLEDANGPLSLPVALVASISRDTETDLLDVRLVDAPYAIQCYLPRPSLQVSALENTSLAIPWDEILWISNSDNGVDVAAPATCTQKISATFPDSEPVVFDFPVTVFSLQSPAGDLLIPSTRISRISLNSDRSHTLITVFSDILTGKLAFPDLSLDDSDILPDRLEKAASIQFQNVVERSAPDNALAWRLASGDILVGTRDAGDTPERAAAPSSAAPVGRIAAAQRTTVAAPSARSSLPQQTADGTWPEKLYAVNFLAGSKTLDIPSKILDTVRPLPISSLPPATIPSGPSALVSDEVVFEGGEFHLGRTSGTGPSDEVPTAFIQIAPFAMASTPVTVNQFRAFVDDTGYVTTAERMSGFATWKTPGFAQSGDHPVVCISWLDAANYCNWRSKRARLTPAYTIRDGGYRAILDPDADGYRLPLEAEWEFAARNGGQDILFPWGSAASEAEALQFANFNPDEVAIDPWPNTNPVKAFPAVPSGLFGMAGNVYEWCQDRYDANAYAASYRIGDIADLVNPDPKDFVEGKINRVIRGGSFRNPLTSLRCTARAWGFEQVGAPHVGMRLVRNAD